MKFDDKYPDADPCVDYDFEGDSVFMGTEPDKCFQCGDMTYWISLSFGCMLCSEECNRKMWQEYFEAL